MQRRSRSEQIEDEKRAAGGSGFMTSSEVCRYLNISPRTFRARMISGKIPPAEVRSSHGWGLWSPEQCKELLARELERKQR